MNRRRAWIVAGAVFAAIVLVVIVVLITQPDDEPQAPTPSPSEPTASAPSEPSPSDQGSDESPDAEGPVEEGPVPGSDDESTDEDDGSAGQEPDDDPASRTDLCDRVTAEIFEGITGLTVDPSSGGVREQCDYAIVDGPEGVFARVTQRPLEDHGSWAAYAATQPDGPDVTRPSVADGAYVSVVDGGDVRYVTAEAGVGVTVITWELALPATPADARDQATALLQAATEGIR